MTTCFKIIGKSQAKFITTTGIISSFERIFLKTTDLPNTADKLTP
jgi:hypothetical protein